MALPLSLCFACPDKHWCIFSYFMLFDLLKSIFTEPFQLLMVYDCSSSSRNSIC